MRSTVSFKFYLLIIQNKSWIWMFIFVTAYFLFILAQQKQNQNMYDFIIEITEFLSLAHVVIPAYLIILTVHFSKEGIQNYMAFRCNNRHSWYKLNLKTIAMITTSFVFVMFVIAMLLALFVLDFVNNWSSFAKEYYSYHNVFLQHVSPLLYLIGTFILLWLLLYCLGMVFFISFLAFRRPFISLIIVLLINVMNVGITISNVDWLNQLFWTKRVSIFEYTYMSGVSQLTFPFQIYLYWFVLIIIFYLIGYIVVHRADLDTYRGKRNDVH